MMGQRAVKFVNPSPCHHSPNENRNRYTSPLPRPCRTSNRPTHTQFPFPSRGLHYLQISWGDNGGGTGWRSQVWHTSQAVASKSPGSPGTPLFIDRELPVGGEGEAAQEGGVPEGPGLLPAQRPLQGGRSRGFCAGPEAHVRCWRLQGRTCGGGVATEPPGKGVPRRSVVTPLPRLRDSHRDSGSLEKGVERPASIGDASKLQPHGL